MTTPAAELRTAADKLRDATPAEPAFNRARDPLAKLLRETGALHEPNTCDKHEGCTPFGCQWCGDEDWPCNDMRNALAVARAINGSQP
ncbi:hypothetical protein [Streptomyces sp. bgisy154]|uniref:hypothetical protein n=1 Tax=Streptomyces sp. bgisy154 TaxID=3413794 RepID=UPI003D75DC5F